MAEWIDGYSFHNGKVVYYSIDCSNCDCVFKHESAEVVNYWKESFKFCPFCGEEITGGNEDV